MSISDIESKRGVVVIEPPPELLEFRQGKLELLAGKSQVRIKLRGDPTLDEVACICGMINAGLANKPKATKLYMHPEKIAILTANATIEDLSTADEMLEERQRALSGVSLITDVDLPLNFCRVEYRNGRTEILELGE